MIYISQLVAKYLNYYGFTLDFHLQHIHSQISLQTPYNNIRERPKSLTITNDLEVIATIREADFLEKGCMEDIDNIMKAIKFDNSLLESVDLRLIGPGLFAV